MTVVVANEECTKNTIQTVDDIETIRKTFTVRGLSGLVNLGNTCFMNSALQSLSATTEFIGYLQGNGDEDGGEYKDDLKYSIMMTTVLKKKKEMELTGEKKTINIKMSDVKKIFKESFAYKLRCLYYIMWGTNCMVKPLSIKEKLGELKSMFRGTNQHDSAECLNLMLDQFHEDTKTDVIVTAVNIPEKVKEYGDIKNEYMKILTDDTQSGESKVLITNLLSQLKKEHIKEETFLEGMIFWEKYLKQNHSIITDIFEGLCLNQITCHECKNVSTKFDPFNILQVPLQKETTIATPSELDLDTCIRENLVRSEIISGDNQYECNICNKKTDAERHTSIWNAPSKLIIHLKRFTSVELKLGETKHIMTKKISSLINFPIEGLNIKNYMSPYVSNDIIYDLYAVICHFGGMNGGHYVAYTKNPINKQWYLFDDDNVLHIEDEKLHEELVSQKAYMLFYERRE